MKDILNKLKTVYFEYRVDKILFKKSDYYNKAPEFREILIKRMNENLDILYSNNIWNLLSKVDEKYNIFDEIEFDVLSYQTMYNILKFYLISECNVKEREEKFLECFKRYSVISKKAIQQTFERDDCSIETNFGGYYIYYLKIYLIITFFEEEFLYQNKILLDTTISQDFLKEKTNFIKDIVKNLINESKKLNIGNEYNLKTEEKILFYERRLEKWSIPE